MGLHMFCMETLLPLFFFLCIPHCYICVKQNSLISVDNKAPSLNQALQFNCEHCMKCFDSKRKRYIHIRTVHAQRKHSCDVCGKRFVDKTALKVHSFTHSSVPQFECSECYKKYRSESGLFEHKRIIHLCIKFKCDLCDKSLTTKTGLSNHNKFVHNIGEIVRMECDFCHSTYKRRNDLILHLHNNHLNLKKVTCDICHKIMLNKKTLLLLYYYYYTYAQCRPLGHHRTCKPIAN
jgi:hypothetical protein